MSFIEREDRATRGYGFSSRSRKQSSGPTRIYSEKEPWTGWKTDILFREIEMDLGGWAHLSTILPYDEGLAKFERTRVYELQLQAYRVALSKLIDREARNLTRIMGRENPQLELQLNLNEEEDYDGMPRLRESESDDDDNESDDEEEPEGPPDDGKDRAVPNEAPAPMVPDEKEREVKAQGLAQVKREAPVQNARRPPRRERRVPRDAREEEEYAALNPPLMLKHSRAVSEYMKRAPKPDFDYIPIRRPKEATYDFHCRAAGAFIANGLEREIIDILDTIGGTFTRPYAMLVILDGHFIGTQSAGIHQAIFVYENMKHIPGEKAEVLIRRLTLAVRDLTAHGAVRGEVEVRGKMKYILRGHKHWEALLTQIVSEEASGRDGTLQELYAKMRLYDQNRRLVASAKAQRDPLPKEKKMFLQAQKTLCRWLNTPKGCFKGKSCAFSHDSSAPAPRSKPKTQKGPAEGCYNCGKPHYARNCPKSCLKVECKSTAAHKWARNCRGAESEIISGASSTMLMSQIRRSQQSIMDAAQSRSRETDSTRNSD